MRRSLIIVAFAALAAAGCVPKNAVMRAPTLFASGETAPFAEAPERERSKTIEIFYATDREPETNLIDELSDYSERRGVDLRLGVAEITFGRGPETWEEIAESSLERRRPQTIPMNVTRLEEYGILYSSMMPFDPRYGDETNIAGQGRWADLLNERLAESASKDITIFVSPFKISFDEGMQIAAQFHLYTGRTGVFMCFSWPTSIKTLGYLRAAETAYASAFNLRRLIEALSQHTDVEDIHLMSYSAGARSLAYALHELRLLAGDRDVDEQKIRDKYRVGRVIFAGPDLDASTFGQMYLDGMADVADQITIYTTPKDSALGMSQFLFGYQRIGQVGSGDFKEYTLEFLATQEQTNFVEVTKAESAMEANAHGYFKQSPWVSSDIVLTLRHGLHPSERGLVRDETGGLWEFPEDYADRAQELGRKLYPPE